MRAWLALIQEPPAHTDPAMAQVDARERARGDAERAAYGLEA